MDDYDTISDYSLNNGWHWYVEKNHFGSLNSKVSKSVDDRILEENNYWQCIF